jgi:hypothetical protein
MVTSELVEKPIVCFDALILVMNGEPLHHQVVTMWGIGAGTGVNPPVGGGSWATVAHGESFGEQD